MLTLIWQKSGLSEFWKNTLRLLGSVRVSCSDHAEGYAFQTRLALAKLYRTSSFTSASVFCF